MQAPLQQASWEGQTLPQLPQLFGSVCSARQPTEPLKLQTLSPAGQQAVVAWLPWMRELQKSPTGQAFPQ